MRMRLRHDALMRMLVVRIMRVTVLMFQRVVLVFVNMAFREMQPEPQAHQETSKHKLFSVSNSCSSPRETTAPIKGASEK